MDEDWHASYQATHKGVEGEEWEDLYNKSVEMNKEVNVRNPGKKQEGKSRDET